ncbi:hypothetical protein [uncultured Nonlabens sp.]|uniref:hypothetical protein n=1 Tax=uncultured Nonlabens sp. TaxID=859306 RepID=UPI002605B6CA|nr:hypothetical protein [uncultured Nonlabens sp.]
MLYWIHKIVTFIAGLFLMICALYTAVLFIGFLKGLPKTEVTIHFTYRSSISFIVGLLLFWNPKSIIDHPEVDLLQLRTFKQQKEVISKRNKSPFLKCLMTLLLILNLFFWMIYVA